MFIKGLRLTVFALILILSIFALSPDSFSAAACPSDDPCKDKGDVNEKVACYSDIVNTCSAQRQSMAAQIVYLSTSIELTSAKIEATKAKIVQIEKDIVTISEKIDRLEASLTKITQIL